MAYLAIGTLTMPAAAANIPASVIAHEKQLADARREVGWVPARPSAGFLVLCDLGGDGIDDWALDEGKADCAGAAAIDGGLSRAFRCCRPRRGL
ncbi:MAG TPA: hypothetical protein VMB34_11175 [Acetobacteraceae bacterium]|nr:hypothetical protein [Acetobacteraceae bacterium]